MKNKQELVSDLIPRFFDPKNDAAFKKVFVDHLDLTKSFLNATLRLEGERRIKKVVKLPTEQLPLTAESKQSALDVLCTDESGSQYIIEVQNRYLHSYFKRVQYYVSHAYAKQLRIAANYKTLKPVTLISICDHILFPDEVDYLSFHRNAEEKTHEPYLNDHTYVFIELPKFKKKEEELASDEDYWVFMIKSAEGLHEIPPQTPKEIQEAYHILEKHRWTEGELSAYDQARMRQMDDIDAMESATERGLKKGLERGLKKGLEKGRNEGKQERNIEIAKNLLTMGHRIDEIAKITGLSIDDINSL